MVFFYALRMETEVCMYILLQHMVIGGLPLLAISILNHDPALSGSLNELSANDLLALLYTSIFGSAISYGVFFYNGTRGEHEVILVSFFVFLFYFPFTVGLFSLFSCLLHVYSSLLWLTT